MIIDYKLDKPSKHVILAKILRTDEETIQDLVPVGKAKFLEIVEVFKIMSWNI